MEWVAFPRSMLTELVVGTALVAVLVTLAAIQMAVGAGFTLWLPVLTALPLAFRIYRAWRKAAVFSTPSNHADHVEPSPHQ